MLIFNSLEYSAVTIDYKVKRCVSSIRFIRYIHAICSSENFDLFKDLVSMNSVYNSLGNHQFWQKISAKYIFSISFVRKQFFQLFGYTL
jgi:hypothetical protein